MNKIKVGSRWLGSDQTSFIVVSVTDIDGHTWVHYREDGGIRKPIKECKEFSCYAESFIHRFRETVA